MRRQHYWMNLINKLKINPGKPVWILNQPEGTDGLFDALPANNKLKLKDKVGQVVFFVESRLELEGIFSKLVEQMEEDAVCWAAYPKKSSGIISDLVRDDGWEIISASGYQVVTSISINEDWTGIRVRKPDPNATYKRAIPMGERVTEGIDYVNRTAVLPVDALKAMKSFKGLEAFFNSMSFTHKREYVEAIVEAKKPETRQRRIDKMIEMVLKLQEQKELKKKR